MSLWEAALHIAGCYALGRWAGLGIAKIIIWRREAKRQAKLAEDLKALRVEYPEVNWAETERTLRQWGLLPR